MSDFYNGFDKLPRKLHLLNFEDKKGKEISNAKRYRQILILSHIGSWGDKGTITSYETLSEMLNCSLSTTIRDINSLIEAGYLRKTGKAGARKKRLFVTNKVLSLFSNVIPDMDKLLNIEDKTETKTDTPQLTQALTQALTQSNSQPDCKVDNLNSYANTETLVENIISEYKLPFTPTRSKITDLIDSLSLRGKSKNDIYKSLLGYAGKTT